MIDVGTFVAWESPTSGITYKGCVHESACRVLVKKKPQDAAEVPS